jgi:hypothetical protein
LPQTDINLLKEQYKASAHATRCTSNGSCNYLSFTYCKKAVTGGDLSTNSDYRFLLNKKNLSGKT